MPISGLLQAKKPYADIRELKQTLLKDVGDELD
eukprot:CAMPEP_0197834498 /NCGR_PEP_ID=MMETSP1437-20131217/22552_1 /TAXON_ID=49252 ORGANISM="Eucampia antarctica, Strain CCMP1452" /NCGR_SAMPLE_ID=MMETSP1437 /ASSEMBLY_ACC=CAM_ASM_001096 /LENGTH=32 /DNA_ID= /DNA_START= /DNA_END= /DNA_ORIENTATION=